jgi:hypothetical protein
MANTNLLIPVNQNFVVFFLSNSGVNPFCSSIDFTIVLRLVLLRFFEVWQCVQFVLHLDFQWYLFDIGK